MEQTKNLKVHQILYKAYLAKRKKLPAYSQRALARDLGTSPVFVTNILTGKKNVPSARFKKLFKALDIDITVQTQVMRAAVVAALPTNELKAMAKLSLNKDPAMESYSREDQNKFSLLQNWYNIAILNYIGGTNLDQSIQSISDYFAIRRDQTIQALKDLEAHGFVRYENDRYFKVENHNYFSTTKSREEVRQFHRQMINKAQTELQKNSLEDFERRLITGFTLAADDDKIELAKKMISEFLGELSNTLGDGANANVYQCNIQFFPLRGVK